MCHEHRQFIIIRYSEFSGVTYLVSPRGSDFCPRKFYLKSCDRHLFGRIVDVSNNAIPTIALFSRDGGASGGSCAWQRYRLCSVQAKCLQANLPLTDAKDEKSGGSSCQPPTGGEEVTRVILCSDGRDISNSMKVDFKGNITALYQQSKYFGLFGRQSLCLVVIGRLDQSGASQRVRPLPQRV
jgi:hypothetical protein